MSLYLCILKLYHARPCAHARLCMLFLTKVPNAYGIDFVFNDHDVLIRSRYKRAKYTHGLQNDEDFKYFTMYDRRLPDYLYSNLTNIMGKNGNKARIHNTYHDVIIDNAIEINSVAYKISMVQHETVTAIATHPASQCGTHTGLSQDEASARIHESIKDPDEYECDSQ
jgi:hypothetical protein